MPDMNPLKDLCREMLKQDEDYLLVDVKYAKKLAKACLVLLGGLEDFSDPKLWRPSEREPMKSLGWTPAELAIQCIAKAQAIVGEK